MTDGSASVLLLHFTWNFFLLFPLRRLHFSCMCKCHSRRPTLILALCVCRGGARNWLGRDHEIVETATYLGHSGLYFLYHHNSRELCRNCVSHPECLDGDVEQTVISL